MKKRIVIIGAPGAGKSTLGESLSRKLGVSHIDLDSLHWGTNWTRNDTFSDKLMQRLYEPEWVVSGAYYSVQQLIWSEASIMIWLDYPFFFVLIRLLRRSFKRIFYKESLWNGNKESLGRLLSPSSVLRWMWKVHFRYKRGLEQVLRSEDYKHLQVIRIRSHKDVTSALLTGNIQTC